MPPDDTSEPKRNNKQNSALHLWCKQIADQYTNQGLTVEEVIKNFTMELYWTPEAVKEILIKTATKRMFNKSSTTQLLRHGEIDKIVDAITKFNSQLGIDYIPFPSLCDRCGHLECVCG